MHRLHDKYGKDIIAVWLLIAAVTGIMLWGYYLKDMYPFGKELIACGDMGEFIPETFYYIWDILHGNGSPFFSWKVGMGINISGSAAEQAFLSPLNLFLLLSKRECLIYFINIMVILKLVCIAVSMYVYLRSYRVQIYLKLAASTIYALSAACLVHYHMGFVLDAAFIFPLLMVGMRMLLEKKKAALFIIMCTFSLVINVYMSIMIFLFIFIAGWLKIASFQEKGERKKLASIFGISSFLSVLLSAFIMLPALLSIMRSSRGAGLLQQLKAAILSPQIEGDVKAYMLLGLMLPLAIIIMNGMEWKCRGREYTYHKWICILLLSSLIIPGTELIWHGGSRVAWPVRYAFMISFVCIDFAMYILQQQKLTVICKMYAAQILCILITGVLAYKLKQVYIGSQAASVIGNRGFCLLLYGVFLTVYLLLLHGKKLVLLLIGMEMICGVVWCIPEHAANVRYIFDAHQIAEQTKPETSVFERIKNPDYSLLANYPFVLDCSSISNFVHVIDRNLQGVFHDLGYSTVYTRLLDTGGTAFSDALLNEKYVITTKELPEELYVKKNSVTTESGISYLVYETKYRFPFGVPLNSVHERGMGTVFENQNGLFRDIMGTDAELICDLTADIRENKLHIQIPKGQKKAAYLYYDAGYGGTLQICLNGQYIPFSAEAYPSTYENNMIELGVFEGEDVEISLEGTADYNASGVHIGLLDVHLLEQACRDMNRQMDRLLLKEHNTGITADISINSGKYVFFPVPFDGGWKCRVNGRRQDIVSQVGFIAVPVEAGQNHIELYYIPNGRKTGSILSGLGVLACVFFVCWRKVNAENECVYLVRNIIYVVYGVAFWGLMTLLYILPGVMYLILYII